MDLAFLGLLPAALLFDRLFGEPPLHMHPVRMMGNLAEIMEKVFRRMAGKNSSSSPPLFFCGAFACLSVILPCVIIAWGLTWMAGLYTGPQGSWFIAAIIISFCLAPRSLAEHALQVTIPLEANNLERSRQAVSLIVGRNPDQLDAQGVARACIESVGENLTDGVLSTLFWAGIGLIFGGYSTAASFAVLHRCANTLDALWGKKNERYLRFGTFAAYLDDILNALPARLSLPCIVLASFTLSGLTPLAALRTGWRWRYAHESPNSAWSEAAFAGALGLKLGGPTWYKDLYVPHPWLGDGTLAATSRHIRLAVKLMWRSVLIFTLGEAILFALLQL